jgi:putative transposase
VKPERDRLRQEAIRIHRDSRGAAGARTIAGQLNQLGENISRYQAAGIMREAGLISSQPRRHRYLVVNEDSKIAPNLLKRLFNVKKINQVW